MRKQDRKEGYDNDAFGLEKDLTRRTLTATLTRQTEL